VPGWDVQVLGDDGTPLGPDREGAVVVGLPLPPGSLPTLWGDDQRFVRSYLQRFPGYYVTGDGGHVDYDGYLFVMGRVDDGINVAGHRLSTGTLEAVLATHPSVAECAVIGAADQLKGQVPVGLVVLKAGVQQDPAQLRAELVAMVRQAVGAVASFKEVVVVDRLPKTRSGKILRGTMRSIADHQPFNIPSTIDDPAIIDEIQHALVVRERPRPRATT
jgi:propionyl-CoA synthetase